MGKRGRPYLKAACLTCKARRVKCDTRKPNCWQCMRTGRTCDRNHVEPSGPPSEFANLLELRSFKFFCEKTSSELSSYYDELFWTKVAIQISNISAGVKHLLVAIGALHEKLKQETPCLQNGALHIREAPSLALQQCNASIQSFATEASSGSNIVVTLTSCVLFSAFEMMQDKLESALLLLSNGSRIFEEWKSSSQTSCTSSERELLHNCLHPMLVRFGESSEITHTAASKTSECTPASPMANNQHKNVCRSSPPKFSSLTHALTCLHDTLNWGFAEISLAQSDRTASQLRLHKRHTALLETWNKCFQDFLKQSHPDTRQTHYRRHCLIELQYLTAKVFHAALLFEDEMIYDDYTQCFERIIILCRRVVKLEAIGSTSSIPQMSFSFDLGIIMPLYFTAAKCRHPVLRRHALQLLQTCPRREGIWLSWVTGFVAEQIISIEETGLNPPETSQDIPLSNRIQLLEMQYDPCLTTSLDQSALRIPVLGIKWLPCSSWQMPGSKQTRFKTIRLSATNDSSPGQRPYRVVVPVGPQYDHWKLLMGKKTFCTSV